MDIDWPLVGRDGEIAKLRATLVKARRGVVLCGAAGVGKSRLADECLTFMAELQGVATMRVCATRSAAAMPFGALAPLLPPIPPDDFGIGSLAGLLRRFTTSLLEQAGDGHLFLVVDDAHLLDDASATLLHQLVATGTVIVLMTVRTEERSPESVMALWKDGLVDRIDLGGLSAEAIEELIPAVLKGPVDGGAIASLEDRSLGNVLYLRELVIGSLANGQLREVNGLWRLVGVLSPSQRLTELVDARLADLAIEERNFLEVVAVGEPIGSAELNAMGGHGIAEGLLRKALLSSRLNGRRLETRLAHPVIGDVLRSALPPARLRVILRSLAEVVEAAGARRREDTLRVASWRLVGGGGSPDLMLAAASTARTHYDLPLAEQFARASIESGGGFPARLLAAQLAGRQGRSQQVDRELIALVDLAADDSQRAQVAMSRLDNHVFSLGGFDEGIRIAEEAEASVTDKSCRDDLAARRVGLLLATHGFRVAAAAAEPLVQGAGGAALVWAAFTSAFSLGRLGRIEEAIVVASKGYEAHIECGQRFDWDPAVQLVFRYDALAYGGRFEEGEALALAHYQRAVHNGNAEAQAFCAWHLAKTVGERGHVGRAARYAREAAELWTEAGPQRVSYSFPYLVMALALARKPEAAAAAICEFEALRLPPTYYVAVDMMQARAWAAVAAGDVPTACHYLRDAAQLGEEIGDFVGASAALHVLARLGHPGDAEAQLVRLATVIEGDLIQARAAHVSALVARSAEGLELASVAFERMGAYLLAAEAAADAGMVWRRSGSPRQAAAAGMRVGSLKLLCSEAHTPSLDAAEVRASLTRAEREVSRLAAAGYTNRQIADHLCLSLRTVQNHMQHVYEKLGIAGRNELAGAFTPDGSLGSQIPAGRTFV
jgi:DNA-binding CsgD family transcriptional regulator